MVVLGGWALSYERGIPVGGTCPFKEGTAASAGFRGLGTRWSHWLAIGAIGLVKQPSRVEPQTLNLEAYTYPLSGTSRRRRRLLLSLYFPVTCNPSRAVTLPNIGVLHRVTYP